MKEREREKRKEKRRLRLFLLPAAKSWFGASSSENGWSRYIPLSFYQSYTYLVVKDICIIEAEVMVLGIGSPF
jgi:hypothetical protein